MREVIKQAATVDEAIELALRELSLTREQVTCEVLEYPEKRFFFKKPAKVKVVEIEEEFSVKELFEEPKPVKKEEPKAEKPAKKENKKQPKPQPKQEVKAEVKAEVKEEPKAEEVKAEEVATEEANTTEIALADAPAKVKYAVDFIKSVIGQFYDKEAEFRIVKTQTGYIIKIVGEDAGCLIGRKGETMEALSYLTSLASNRFEDSDEKISVDVADYRQKREKDLVAMAKKMAAKVNKSGRSYSFEPMNPYERRIIHATVSEINGVKSESKGEGSGRKVVIYPTNPRKAKPAADRKGKNGGNNRRNNRDKKEKAAPGGVLDIDTEKPSTIDGYEPGYIDKDLEEIVG
ncbi:MAG: Jag N-terminal domain-containing protein, partial [Oscillospiraceae bacterium]|nr:Jag N-terminal domain-containing protein [Oscillospiraceae bacterium]